MWTMSTPWYELIFRASIIFIGLFLMFKVWGRKHLGKMSALDLILLLIMSEAVQNSLVQDDKSIQGGLIVVATFMILSSLMNIIAYHSRKVEHFTEGTAKVIIRDGKMMEDVLKKERISLSELFEAIREQGVLHLHDIQLAMLEANGKISVIKKENIKGLSDIVQSRRISWPQLRKLFSKKSLTGKSV